MKVRNGFVSNSSSSSFIINDNNFKDKKDIYILESIYRKLEDSGDVRDDYGTMFDYEHGIVRFTAHHIDDSFLTALNSMLIDKDAIIVDYM